jgi:hypothetical protein
VVIKKASTCTKSTSARRENRVEEFGVSQVFPPIIYSSFAPCVKYSANKAEGEGIKIKEGDEGK